MKQLVCISKTPDTTAKIRFEDGGKNFIEEGVQYILNPYDEWYALVRALEIKEQFGGQVDIVHVGDSSSEILLRKALAIGADSAYRIDDIPTSSDCVASQIASFAKANSYDIIYLGKETIDHNSSEVGSKLAGLLDLPFLSYCNKLEIHTDQKAICSLEIEGGNAIVEVRVPFVVSAAKGLAEQRIPNMKGIIDAKKKPLHIIEKSSAAEYTELIRFETPAPKTGVRMIHPDQLDELVNVIKNDLKLI
jgi:electron transfer flavoprotein beta subunit